MEEVGASLARGVQKSPLGQGLRPVQVTAVPPIGKSGLQQPLLFLELHFQPPNLMAPSALASMLALILSAFWAPLTQKPGVQRARHLGWGHLGNP